MRRRTVLVVAAAVALAVVVAVGLVQAGSDGGDDTFSMSVTEQREALAGAPAPLAALHAQAGEIVEGSLSGRLRELRGHPVVINKWASWCGPCALEMPIFARVAVKYGKRVAFLGLATKDSRSGAERFLSRHPVSYPSYWDPKERLAREVGAGTYFPTTVFIDARGRTQLVHQGPFPDAATLEKAIHDNLGV
jgi:thiol-disulfide isomerase/thioredoxin